MEEDTPRTVIQDLMNAADTNETDRPVRKRKRLTRTPDADMNVRLSRSVPSTEISLYQQDDASPHYSMMERSTPVRKTSTRNKRESLVDTVRRKRFKFRRSELFQAETESSVNGEQEISLNGSEGTGEPRRKSLRLANLSVNQELSSTTTDSHLLSKMNSKRQRPQYHFSVEKDSTKSSSLRQTGSLRLSPRKQMTPTVRRSSPRIQPTSVQEQQDLSDVEFGTVKSTPRGRPRLDSVKVNSVSKMGDQNRSPDERQSAGHVREEKHSRLAAKIVPTSPNTSMPMQTPDKSNNQNFQYSTPNRSLSSVDFNRVKHSTSKMSAQSSKGTPSKINRTPVQQKSTSQSSKETPSKINRTPVQQKSTSQSSKGTPSKINRTPVQQKSTSQSSKGTPSTINRTPVQQKSTSQSSKGTPSTINRTPVQQKSSITSSQLEDAANRTPPPSVQNPRNSINRTPMQQRSSIATSRMENVANRTRLSPPSSLQNQRNSINRTLIQQRSSIATSRRESVANRTPPLSVQNLRNSISPILGIANKEAAMTPVFEHTSLGPRHSSPLSRTHHISMSRDENLPDVSMIKRSEKTYFEDDLDRTELFRLRTPHLGPARPHIPTPSDTPAPPTLNHRTTITHPEKQKPVIKPKIKKPREKVQSNTIPAAVIKQTFSHFCKMRVDKDTLPELVKITDIYFDQVAHDLETFAHHAGRKTIDERDVELLLKRQKFITKTTSLTHLVEKYLPLELRQEIIPMARSGNKIFPKL